MGSGSWSKTLEELGWRKGFAVISTNIKLREFRFQLLTAGKKGGESTSKQYSKEHNHLEAGKGRLFLLYFICVGTSERENTENSLLPVKPWISPDLPSATLIILGLLGTHNLQIWLGSPKLQELLCWHQLMWASTKGRENVGISNLHHSFCTVKQQWFNSLFKFKRLLEKLSFLGIAWAPESLCEVFPCCRGK